MAAFNSESAEAFENKLSRSEYVLQGSVLRRQLKGTCSLLCILAKTSVDCEPLKSAKEWMTIPLRALL